MAQVIGGTGVLQGDQFTRASEQRTAENHQKIGDVAKMALAVYTGGASAGLAAAAL